jgi:hypothetical protein
MKYRKKINPKLILVGVGASCVLAVSVFLTIDDGGDSSMEYETSRNRPKSLRSELAHSNKKLSRMDTIKLAQHIDGENERIEAVKKHVADWMNDDTDECIKWANGLSYGDERDAIFTKIALILARRGDIEKLEVIVQSVAAGSTRDRMISYCIDALVRQNPEKAMVLLGGVSSPRVMHSASGDFVRAFLDSRKIEELDQMVSDLPYGLQRDSVSGAIVSILASEDPRIAMDWICSHKDSVNHNSLKKVAERFAMIDPVGGIKAASFLVNNDERNSYLSVLAADWCYKDPVEAGKWMVGNLVESGFESNREILDPLIRVSIEKDQDLFLSQIEAIEDEKVSSLVKLKVAGILGEKNPQKAFSLLASTVGGDQNIRSDALNSVAREWLERDPLQASQSIGEMQSGADKDVLVGELVRNIMNKDKDIDMARKWAETIQNEKERESLIKMIENKAKMSQ